MMNRKHKIRKCIDETESHLTLFFLLAVMFSYFGYMQSMYRSSIYQIIFFFIGGTSLYPASFQRNGFSTGYS